MERFDVRLLRNEHNLMCVLKAVFYSLVAVPAWIFSYGFAYYVPWLVAHSFKLDWLLPLCHPIAIGFLIVLALEGFRHRNPAPTAQDFVSMAPMGKHRTVGDFYAARFSLQVLILSYFLFAAPRSTLNAVRSLRSLMKMTEAEARIAERVVRALAERREWLPASELDPGLLVVQRLSALGMIWLKEDVEGLRIRLSPRAALRFFPEAPVPS